ncbi:MAG: hypothetical protein WCF10_04430 [Polyangiales bacterium]
MPKKADTATSEGLFVRLKPELITRLRIYAATTRQSLSGVVGEALDHFLRSKEKR